MKRIKPADIPVEQPTVFEFVLNKTAKALQLAIPLVIRVQVTETIE